MRINIMLCFLSDVKLNREGKPSVAEYQNIGEKKECHTTNESAVRYLICGADEIQGKLSKLFLVRTKMVAGEIRGYKPENERETWGKSHYAYFLHRISDVVSNAEAIAEPIDFNEDKPMEENMNVLIDVASHVRRYANEVKKNNSDTEIILHVDFTGGLRNASMILVALMRLLQYENIHIGKVLYSDYHREDPSKNWVEEVNPLYSFFDLVAGAEEFVRHGEVTVMNKFFEKRATSQVLKDLLLSMSKFAEELKLCHYGDLRNAIGELRRAIAAFAAASSTDASAAVKQNDDLMHQMLGRIREDYQMILKEKLDDIALIRWCIAHNLLQQAMTLFIERVPEVLEQCGFLSIESEFQADFTAKLAEDSMNRSRGFFLVNEYKVPKGNKKSKKIGNLDGARAAWRKKRQAFFKRFRQGVTEDERDAFVCAPVSDSFEVQLKDADELRRFLIWLDLLRRSDDVDEELRASAESCRFFQRLAPLYRAANKPKDTGLSKTQSDVWEALLALRDKGVVSKLIKCVENVGINVDGCDFLDIEWKSGMRRRCEAGIRVDDEKRAGRILNNYFAVKVERNHTSHARAETGRMAVEKLRNLMEETLRDTEIARKGITDKMKSVRLV